MWPALPQLRELKRASWAEDGGQPSQLPVVDESTFRTAASLRVLETWGLYETLPESAQDAGIASIRNVVKVLRDVQAKQQGTS